MPANVFRFEESWEIPGVSVEDVYDVLSRGELLPLWWKGVYLKAERLDGAGPPKVGDRIRATARGFLPYRLRFIIEATELESPRRVAVRTIGDFDGRWTALLSPKDGGVHVDLIWEVTVLRPILKFLAPLLRPAFAWNHRWTTPRGEKGLRDYLRRRAAPAPAAQPA
ncbi:MAG: SRPBCC family protein [Methylocystis sp.]|nr:SRPBCC family protein [Methylocystis sp.]